MKFRSPLAVAVVMTMAIAGCSDSATEGADDGAAVVESYISAYNDGDLDAVMTHFTEESVIVGHPTDFDPQANDIYSIESLHKEDLQYDQTYVISNVLVDGDTVTWDSVWGEDGCVKGQSAVVKEDKILTWTWGDFVDCAEIG
jgi:hypothetical protein